jgi:hypothetical protein
MLKECKDQKLKSNVFKAHKYHQMTKKQTINFFFEKIKKFLKYEIKIKQDNWFEQ